MWDPGPSSRGRRTTRRGMLRAAAAGAGGAALAPLLAACSSGAVAAGKSTAAPAVHAGTIVLRFAPNWQGAAWNKTALTLNQEFFDNNYTPKNPGVRVLVNNGSAQGSAATQVAASIAGTGYLDVFQDCCNDFSILQAGGLLTPLNNNMKQDNVDPTIWSASHLAALTYNGQVLGLPAYDGPATVFYRQDILDSLGLAYPDPSWDYKAATSLWQQCVGKTRTGAVRGGISIFDTPWYETMNWWLRAFGGPEMDATQTLPYFDKPYALAMAAYVQQNRASNVIIPRSGFSGPLNQGTCVFKQSGGWELLPAVETMGTSIKWDILPMPYWPSGKRSTYNNVDFYVQNSATKHPEHAWQLLKYVCAEPDYQRFQMQATLVQPSLLSLWDNWESLVVGTAPLLKTKSISWIKDAAMGGYNWPNAIFHYESVSADNLVNNWMGLIEGPGAKDTPTAGLAQLQQQMAALQSNGAAEEASAVSAARAFPTNGKPIAAMPPGI